MPNRIEQPSRLRANRVASFAVLALLSLYLPGPASAQWATSGNNINNTNTGNVGVGTAAPPAKLSITEVGAWPSTNFGALFVEATNTVGSGMNLSANSTGGRNFLLLSTGADASPGAGSFSIFDVTAGGAASSYRFVINSTGNVGVGTTAPAHKLDVAGNANANALCIGGDCKTSWSQVGGGTSSQWTTNSTNIHYGGGNVGIGNTAPAHTLDVLSAGRWVARFRKTDAMHGGILVDAAAGYNPNVGFSAGGVIKWYMNSNVSAGDSLQFWEATGGWPRMTITQGGNVGVGTDAPTSKLHVAGDIRVDGNINAKYQDVAEWVPSTQKLAAGTVVILDPERRNHVLASQTSYDTSVAGVVSERPGLSLGEAGEGKALVATTGRVKVKVDATHAPIKIGDLIVTSDLEGVAMKSQPIEIGGRRIHSPGTIIGKVLEPLEKGKGEILVLLSLQ